MKHFKGVFVAILISGTSVAQIPEVSMQTVTRFVNGYNSQNFRQMREVMSRSIRLIFSKKRVRVMYGTQFELMGKARIEHIIKRSEGSYLINLKYDRDTTETHRLGLAISAKGKIIGIGRPAFKFHYPLNDSASSVSPEAKTGRIDSLASLKHHAASFNGCVLVVKERQPVYKKCFGYADIESKSPLSENTLYDLASLSKQFTAMAIMILNKQGKLGYSNFVQEVIPEFPYKDISIQNLLNHTSGLPDYMEIFEKKWDHAKIAYNKDVLEYFVRNKPEVLFKPGTAYDYSNTGYVILALIVEKASGITYSRFLNDYIFQPLEMNASKVITYDERKKECGDCATGHTYDVKTKKHIPVNDVAALDYYRYLGGITGDGAVHSTLNDLVKWTNGLRNYSLVDKEEFEIAVQSVPLGKKVSDYGYGWELQNNNKYQKLIYHSGSWGGNFNFILHMLDTDLSVIILSNNEYLNIDRFAYKVADIMRR